MPMNKPHLEFTRVDMNTGWATPPGYPAGIKQKILASDLDESRKMGSRTRLLRFDPGVYTTAPFVHDHWEEVYLISGDLIVGNDTQGKGGEAFDAPTYACRPPGVHHGPFKSDRGCLLYEIHYYDESKKKHRIDPSAEGITMLAPEETLKLSTKPYLSATPRFAGGSDTPREFLERCLADLVALEPKIGAFVNLNLDGARAAADRATSRWRAGRPLSKIDGMPVGIKDIIETADMPTENGSPLFAGFRSERDGASVAALREAGAVVVGKTVTTEFAATEPRGTRNPHDLRRTPGGSSSGSAAAVASGMLSAALGTQVIGSTIRPASYCGCVGFKVTVGALNRGGSYDGLSQSATGVLAATLEDAWQVAYEIAMRAGGDPGYPGLFGPASAPAAKKPRRIAFLETAGWAAASAGAKQAMADALARIKTAGMEVF